MALSLGSPKGAFSSRSLGEAVDVGGDTEATHRGRRWVAREGMASSLAMYKRTLLSKFWQRDNFELQLFQELSINSQNNAVRSGTVELETRKAERQMQQQVAARRGVGSSCRGDDAPCRLTENRAALFTTLYVNF